MTCLRHVRNATDQGAQFAPRIESLRADQKKECSLLAAFLFSLLVRRDSKEERY